MLWAGLWWGGAKCLLSVCPPWTWGWEGRMAVWEKECFLVMGKGELVSEKTAVLSIPGGVQGMRCGALVPLL